MGLLVFEDQGWERLGPPAHLKHSALLNLGTTTILAALEKNAPERVQSLWGRSLLSDSTRELVGVSYNESHSGNALLLNARARPSKALFTMMERKAPFACMSEGTLLVGRLNAGRLTPGILSPRQMASAVKDVERVEAPPDSLFGGYWDLVESNGVAIAKQAQRFDDELTLPLGVEVKGPSSNLMIHESVQVERHVTLDSRLGPIVIQSGASVESFSRIMGPCYIGERTRLTSALIGGGTSIFDTCKVGGEVESSIISSYSNKAHHGYVGDSYVGEWVNLGAGSTFSNLKNTYGNVRVEIGGSKFDTELVKLGPAVGDMAKVSIGALVFAGKTIGAGSQVTGLARSNIPDFTFSDGTSGKQVELRLDSVIETQRRMMERRGQMLSKQGERLISAAFRESSKDRRLHGVKKGSIG